MKIRGLLVGLMIFGLLAGCASGRSGQTYSRDEARQSLSVYYGTVLAVAPAVIEGTKTPIGPAAGGATGAVLGNSVGGGSGRAIATVIGGIAGALAGGAIEEGVTRRDAYEITVELDDGQLIAVVQEADEEFAVGDRVRIVKGRNGTTRVRQ
jgi:outer membrane lipoprotein SlyB